MVCLKRQCLLKLEMFEHYNRNPMTYSISVMIDMSSKKLGPSPWLGPIEKGKGIVDIGKMQF